MKSTEPIVTIGFERPTWQQRSTKKLMIGTTRSGISYQLRDSYLYTVLHMQVLLECRNNRIQGKIVL